MTTKTFTEFKVYEAYASAYCTRIGEKETKLVPKINRSFRLLADVFKKQQEEEAEIRRDHCYVEKDIIIRDQFGNYKYTKANEKKMVEAIREQKEKKLEMDFTNCYVKEAPADLSENEIVAFEGIVISPEMAKELLVKFD